MEIVIGIVILLVAIGVIVGIIKAIVNHKKGFAIITTIALGIFLIFKFGGSILAIGGVIVAAIAEYFFVGGGDE